MVKSLKSATNKKIIIGRVGAAHGVKGEFKVYPLTDFPDRFEKLKDAFIGGNPVKVVSTRYQNSFIVMRIEGIDSREAVATITNKLMEVDRAAVPPLAPGEYYTFDIIGLKVLDEEKHEVGTIKQIIKTGSNDVYVTVMPSGKEILIPALKKVVKEINVPEGYIIAQWEEPKDI